MSPRSSLEHSASILLTGLSGAGKTTLARALVRRLTESGIRDVAIVDGEELRARLPRRYGHSLAEREAVWREAIREARKLMDAGRVVVIAAIVHRASLRIEARERLQPFYEVHLDCAVEVCAERDRKGHYRRALASEYECFIGVTHPYERSDSADLSIDTAALSLDEAEGQLTERVIEFLSKPGETIRPLPWVAPLRRAMQRFVVDSRIMDVPTFRRHLLKNAAASKSVVHMQRPSCAQLVVSYGGIDAFARDGVVSGMRPLKFLRLSGLIGRNLTWIRDPYGDDFAQGISPEIPNVDALAEWTRSYVRSLPHVREVHAIGYSSGSYGALMFGHLCRMKTVWAFSPRTAHTKGHERAMARLKDVLSEPNGVTSYQVLYSASNKRDSAFAEAVADHPGVTLRPYREYGDDHFLLRHLAERGILRTLLPPFVPAARVSTGDPEEGSVSS